MGLVKHRVDDDLNLLSIGTRLPEICTTPDSSKKKLPDINLVDNQKYIEAYLNDDVRAGISTIEQ